MNNNRKTIGFMTPKKETKCTCTKPTTTRVVDSNDIDEILGTTSYYSTVAEFCNDCNKIKGFIKVKNNY